MQTLLRVLIVCGLVFPATEAAEAQDATAARLHGVYVPLERSSRLETGPEESFPASLSLPQEARSPWRYPLVGAVVGAVAGAAFVLVADPGETEGWGDLIGAQAYLIFVPAGAAIGGLVGYVVDRVASD